MIIEQVVLGGAALQVAAKSAQRYINGRRDKEYRKDAKLFQVLVERDAAAKPSLMQDYWEKISSLYEPKKPGAYLSFEIHATEGGISFYTWAPSYLQGFLQKTLNAVHPAAEVVYIPATEDHTRPGNFRDRQAVCATLALEEHYLFNTLQATGERYTADPVTSICAAVSNLREREEVILQFLIRPLHRRILNITENAYHHFTRYGTKPLVYNPYVKTYLDFLPVYRSVAEGMRLMIMQMSNGISATPHKPEDVPTLKAKMASSCLFDVSVRVLSVAGSKTDANNNLQTTLSAFSVLSDKNRFTIERAPKREPFIDAIHERKVPPEPGNALFSPGELAAFLHYPDASVPYIRRLRSRKMPVPDGIPTFNTYEEAKTAGAIVLGYTNFRGTLKYVAFSDIRMLMQHLYAIGGTGSGKTTFLQTLVLETIAHGVGVTYFDVKGDALLKLLRYISPEHRKRVVYIDFSSDDYFLPLNVLQQTGMDAYDLAALIVNVFVTVFGEQSIQNHSQHVLRQALLAVISTDNYGSLLEVYRMFTDESYLDATIGRLEQKGDFPDVLAYWKAYKGTKVSSRKTEHAAILNKLESITQNKQPRYTLCQQRNSLDWRKFMDDGAIVLVNLNMGKLEASIQRFFGTLLTAFIRKAFYTRFDIPEEKDRRPHLFILDEFEKFTKQDDDFKDMLALVRSYGGGLVLTHQSTDQLNQAMMGLIADNTFTQLSLNVGDNSAGKIARMFPGFSPEDLTGLVPWQAVGRLKKLNPQPFTFQTLDFTQFYEDFGQEYAEKIIAEEHRKRYRNVNDIQADINHRYRLTEQNLVTEGVPIVRKKNASGKIKRGKNQ